MEIKKTDYIEKLNNEQKAVVYDASNTCLVNANVGSGKTTVLIAKIIYLHYEKQVPYDNMMVLTFTNKAADEIKERLLELEPELDSEKLKWFGTFHSIAMTLLKEALPLDLIGYTKDFEIIEPEDELELALSIVKDKKLNIKYKNRLKKRLEQETTSKYKDDLEILRSCLISEKKGMNRMSFQDLLEYAVELLSKESQHKKDLSNKEMETNLQWQWIIIDEVQDSDKKQMVLISALKKEDTNLFAVGDPNQVIYSWRGSMFHVFGYLRRHYQAKEYALSKNYRSNDTILEIAQCFQELGKPVEGMGRTGENILVREQYDSFQEALYLADRIKELRKNPSVDEVSEQVIIKRMKHPHYGIGDVIFEDDMMITLAFKEYGQMEFMKMFTFLEEVDL